MRLVSLGRSEEERRSDSLRAKKRKGVLDGRAATRVVESARVARPRPPMVLDAAVVDETDLESFDKRASRMGLPPPTRPRQTEWRADVESAAPTCARARARVCVSPCQRNANGNPPAAQRSSFVVRVAASVSFATTDASQR